MVLQFLKQTASLICCTCGIIWWVWALLTLIGFIQSISFASLFSLSICGGIVRLSWFFRRITCVYFWVRGSALLILIIRGGSIFFNLGLRGRSAWFIWSIGRWFTGLTIFVRRGCTFFTLFNCWIALLIFSIRGRRICLTLNTLIRGTWFTLSICWRRGCLVLRIRCTWFALRFGTCFILDLRLDFFTLRVWSCFVLSL